MDLHPSLESARDTETECIARRSVSIFSRRGTSTRKPKSFSLCQAISDSPQRVINSPMHDSPKQCSRMKKFKLVKPDSGTVLHAVPPETAGISMSPLEIAMATSPNEEILQAIGRSSTSASSRKSSVIETPEPPINTSPVQSSINTRIGVWRNGVAFWDVVQQKRDFEDTAVYTSNPITQGLLPTINITDRPRLSVVIPDQEPRYALRADLSRSRHLLPLIRVAPASTTSRHSMPARRTISDPQRAVHPAFRNTSSFGEDSSIETGPLQSESNSRSSMSSNTMFQDDIFDDISCYSRHSSTTSVGEEDHDDIVENSHWNYMNVPKRSVSDAFSITSPVKAGVFDDASRSNLREFSGQVRLFSGESFYPKTEGHASVSAAKECHVSDQHLGPNYSYALNTTQPASPTLSEAVQDLQIQLGAIQEEPCSTDAGSDTHTENLNRAPTLPRRSRKREWKPSASSARTTPITPPQAGLPVRRQSAPSSLAKRLRERASRDAESVRRAKSVRLAASNNADPSLTIPSLVSSHHPDPSLPSRTPLKPCSIFSQGTFCLMIMANLSTVEDLIQFSAANRTTRQVYQENEMELLKHVLYNQSPSAWELREWSPPDFGDFISSDVLAYAVYTPSAYKASVCKDQNVIQELKSLILTRCQSFLRPETVCALASDSDSNVDRVDAAFYRIWCFCKIFGCEKGRENDLRGQLDWLKGGVLAHQDGCGATLDFKPELDLDGILLNPPEYFAKGNSGGLSAEQLYDVTEIWDCLATLLQGYETSTFQAQQSGIFQNIRHPTDITIQTAVLKEWIAYILTLGPSVVLELARFADDSSDAGIELARLNGWTDWALPLPGTSRTGFFKEPVFQLYEEQLVSSAVDGQEMEVGKRLIRRRQRQGIRASRSSRMSQQWPLRDEKDEEMVCTLGRRDSAMAPEVYKAGRRPSTPFSQVSGGSLVSPASWSPRKVSPVIEERVETFNRLSMLGLDGYADLTSDRAIGKIVEMGFTAVQAKSALKLTDLGNGLRVDRAVDWLLTQC